MFDPDDSGAFDPLPWHQPVWERLQRARNEGRLHHALLFTGLAGLGKDRLVRNLAQSLLCRDVDAEGRPCGTCRDCRLFRAGTHPDLLRLAPEEDSKSGEIRVDQVRALVEAEVLSAQSGGPKVLWVTPAERMNRSAANGLLKTLEEPTSSTLMLLVTAYPGRLLPTIRSRCQQHQLLPPPEHEALQWLRRRAPEADPLPALRLAGGAPLQALRFMDPELSARRDEAVAGFLRLAEGGGDPVALAAAWMKWDLPLLFEWIGGWFADILRLAQHGVGARLSNPDHEAELSRLARSVSPPALHRLWRQAAQAKGRLQSNLNPQLLLETLLIEWNQLATGKIAHARTQTRR